MRKNLNIKSLTVLFSGSDHKSRLILLGIPLILSAFTHIWNITGFPYGISYDENIYLRRAMHVLSGQGLQESRLYDHPYFAQLFLTGALRLIAFPDSLNPSIGDAQSIETLYIFPRLIMGLLAVLDTFLIYKISVYYYKSRTVALVASILFAIMPLSWDTRRVLLESVQLPFFLSSIFFAIYFKANNSNSKNREVVCILISGAFLGLAIFTKIPLFVMIPLVAFLVYTKSNKSLRTLGLWFVPLILIPLIWPIYAISIDQFELWLQGIYFQTHRGSTLLFKSTNYEIHYAVILVSLGIIATVFAAIKRDLFIFLGIVPYLIFLYFIGYVSLWHLIPLLPIVCILFARLIENLLEIVRRYRSKYAFLRFLPIIVALGIVCVGVVTLSMLLESNDNSVYYRTAAYVTQILNDDIGKRSEVNEESKIVLISNPFYSWIPKYVFNISNYKIIDAYDNVPINADRVVFILDANLKAKLNQHTIGNMEKNFDLYNKNKSTTFEDAYNEITVYEYNSHRTKGADTMKLNYNLTSPNQ